jgi:hypothetical protein
LLMRYKRKEKEQRSSEGMIRTFSAAEGAGEPDLELLPSIKDEARVSDRSSCSPRE